MVNEPLLISAPPPRRPEWRRTPAPATPCAEGDSPETFSLRFEHEVDTPHGESLYFAFCYPYGYMDMMARLGWVDALFESAADDDAMDGDAAAMLQRREPALRQLIMTTFASRSTGWSPHRCQFARHLLDTERAHSFLERHGFGNDENDKFSGSQFCGIVVVL